MNKTYQELCDENQRLREGIRSMATALEGGEWADMLTFDPDLGALESAIGRLVEDHNDARGIAIKSLNAAILARNSRTLRDAQVEKDAAYAVRDALSRALPYSKAHEIVEDHCSRLAMAVRQTGIAT